MKITSVETIVTRGLSRPWLFCVIRTDEGVTGYSEFGNGYIPHGLVGLVRDLSTLIIGKDPRPVEKHYMDMYRFTRAQWGGAMQMAIAGVELALWDIKGKALGVPVYELMGGPHRDHQRVYWSHLASYHASSWKNAGVEPLRTWDDVAACVQLAKDAGYTAFKTNIVFPGDPPRSISQGTMGPHDQNLSTDLLNHAVQQLSIMREAAGPDMDICLDINVNFKTEGAIRLGRALEPYRLFWMEIDNQDAKSLAQLKASTKTPICTGEQHLTMRQYQPFFEHRAMDTVKVDVQWQGFAAAKKVADLAETYEMNIAPHNYNGHLSTFQSLNLTASVSNVRIMESDPLQAEWRDELFTNLPEIENSHMKIPQGPGWGTDLDEDAAMKYAYEG
ncbi:MAG: mandelate racemase/muconate lactonizing enzyme family protein [Dehalococcoidia bacterium]